MKALVVTLLLLVSVVAGVRPSKLVHQVPAVYVFGDSMLDVGNNNHLPGEEEVARADKPSTRRFTNNYGVDLPGSGKPTGRFSNGYNVADFVAKSLGFEKSPLAYLVLKSRKCLIPSAISRGVSYASAGAGILDSTNAGSNIPLSKQVLYFKSTKAEMEGKLGRGAVNQHLLSKSFFLLGVGSNDMFVLDTAQGQHQNRTAFVGSLVSNYLNAITDLYKLGARKFGIINVGPLGCLPWVRVLSPTGACADGLNQLAAGFNDALKSMLAGLAANNKMPGLRYSLADLYAFGAGTNLAAFGFVNWDSACCGAGRLNAETDCMPNSPLCANRDGYVFWDNVHPSQRAAMIIAQTFYNGPTQFTAPINFKELAYKN